MLHRPGNIAMACTAASRPTTIASSVSPMASIEAMRHGGRVTSRDVLYCRVEATGVSSSRTGRVQLEVADGQSNGGTERHVAGEVIDLNLRKAFGDPNRQAILLLNLDGST